MLSGQFRKIRRVWPLLLAITTITIVVYWRRNHFVDSNKSLRSTLESLHNSHNNGNNGQKEFVNRHGVHVVVGHYMGPSKLGNKALNLSKDMLNLNEYAPEPNAGNNGRPVVIEPKDLLKMQQLFQINRFNLLASNRIPLNRTLPDVRKKKCQEKYKDYSNLPKASIIIVFHNEAWSTLMRTVWSVIMRSPRELLEEIILVDDASERDFLKKSLEVYVSKLPIKSRIIRAPIREGLVQARLRGAKEARGEVLTFLDAHCECTEGWLVSLLARIAEDPKKVVCPVIDIINDDTFAYVKSFELHWGALNWQLHFRWYTLGGPELEKRKKDVTYPFITPTMAGGLFAMDKKYFFELGGYDEGMKIWGGENLELSFRVWQCGGSIEIVPCSHVGHLFRKSSPYTFPGGVNEILYGNLARVAMVWMDEWSDFYFKFTPEAEKMKHKQNVTERLELRKRLQCKNFEWYLDNVWPQHFFPKKDRFFGRIRHVQSDRCLIKPMGKGTLNQPMGLAQLNQCLKDDNLINMFVMTPEGTVMTDESICLDAPEKSADKFAKVRIMSCSGYPRQKWKYDKYSKQLIHKPSGKCLDMNPSKKEQDGLVLVECNKESSQQWILESVSWR